MNLIEFIWKRMKDLVYDGSNFLSLECLWQKIEESVDILNSEQPSPVINLYNSLISHYLKIIYISIYTKTSICVVSICVVFEVASFLNFRHFRVASLKFRFALLTFYIKGIIKIKMSQKRKQISLELKLEVLKRFKSGEKAVKYIQ